MLKSRHFPETEEEVCNLVHQVAAGSSRIVVQCGHFLLWFDSTEALIVPCIEGLDAGPRAMRVADEYGHFPLATWKFGLSLLDSLPPQKKHVLVLVNDWQYMPKEADRFDFYNDHPTLPETYRAWLAEHPSIHLLRRPRKDDGNTGDYFSEKSLRKAYERHVKDLLDAGRLPKGARMEKDEGLSCSIEDAVGGRIEIYCSEKRAGCMHEVAQLLSEISELASPDLFINIFPLVCKEYVAAGTELGQTLFQHNIRTIINIGLPATGLQTLPGPFTKTEMTIHEFPGK